MFKLVLVVLVSFLMTGCSQSINVFENDQLITKIEAFPSHDTTINVKDYFITYKKNGAYVEGFVENTFDNNKGTFKGLRNVDIEIGENKFEINDH